MLFHQRNENHNRMKEDVEYTSMRKQLNDTNRQ